MLIGPDFWLGLGGGALLGALLAYLGLQGRIAALRQRLVALATRLELERSGAAERLATVQQARQQLAATFSALSQQALRQNSDSFLRLAREHLGQFEVRAQAESTARAQSLQGLLTPLQDALRHSDLRLREWEQARAQGQGQLGEMLAALAASQQDLQRETGRLVQALHRPEVRGRWGELTLRRLVELAGMLERCDFYEQEQVGGLRPDLVIRLPGDRIVVVDVKTPLDAYLCALEAGDEKRRQQELTRHAAQLRARMRELAAKSYWAQFPQSPEFVILFIPGEQFLTAALDRQPELFEEALAARLILATPASFIALLRTVAHGWRQAALSAHAEEIRTLIAALHRELAAFSGPLQQLGHQLDLGVRRYNEAIAAFERALLPALGRFTELGLQPPTQPVLQAVSQRPVPPHDAVPADLALD